MGIFDDWDPNRDVPYKRQPVGTPQQRTGAGLPQAPGVQQPVGFAPTRGVVTPNGQQDPFIQARVQGAVTQSRPQQNVAQTLPQVPFTGYRATQDRRNADRAAQVAQQTAFQQQAQRQASSTANGPTGYTGFSRTLGANSGAAATAGNKAASAAMQRGNAAHEALQRAYANQMAAQGQAGWSGFNAGAVGDQYKGAQEALANPFGGADEWSQGLMGNAAAGSAVLARQQGQRMGGDIAATEAKAAQEHARYLAEQQAKADEAARQAQLQQNRWAIQSEHRNDPGAGMTDDEYSAALDHGVRV